MSPAPKIGISVEGDEQASRNLSEVGLKAKDLYPVRRALARVFDRAQRRRFATHGDGSWPPLSDLTLEYKARMGQPASILRATGTLLASLTGSGGESVEDVRGSSATFGTRVEYARFLFGTTFMPPRRVDELSERDLKEMTEIIGKHILEGSES